MKNNKITTTIVILATLLLAGIAVFTAIRLYQLRQKPVAPNVPESKPKAVGTTCGGIQGLLCPTGEVCIYSNGTTRAPSPDASGTCQVGSKEPIACSLSFSLATPTPSPTPTPTKSPSPTPTPTPNPLCNSACTSNSQCPVGLVCSTGFCRNASCTTKTNCICPTATPSPTPTPTKTPSPTPTPTKTPSPTPTASPSPTPTPVAQCNSVCTSSSQCPAGLSCYIASGSSGYCRNINCTAQTNCLCPAPTQSPSPTPNPTSTPMPTGTQYIAYVPTATPAPQPILPESGTDWPTILGAMFGVLVIVGSLFLAF